MRSPFATGFFVSTLSSFLFPPPIAHPLFFMCLELLFLFSVSLRLFTRIAMRIRSSAVLIRSGLFFLSYRMVREFFHLFVGASFFSFSVSMPRCVLSETTVLLPFSDLSRPELFDSYAFVDISFFYFMVFNRMSMSLPPFS